MTNIIVVLPKLEDAKNIKNILPYKGNMKAVYPTFRWDNLKNNACGQQAFSFFAQKN